MAFKKTQCVPSDENPLLDSTSELQTDEETSYAVKTYQQII